MSGSDRPRRVMRDGLSVTGYEDVSRPRKLNLCRSSRRPPTPYRRALRRRSSSAARSIPRRDRAAATFLEEVDDFPTAFDQARPHESLGQRMPLALHRGGHTTYSGPQVSKGGATGHLMRLPPVEAERGTELADAPFLTESAAPAARSRITRFSGAMPWWRSMGPTVPGRGTQRRMSTVPSNRSLLRYRSASRG